MMRSGLSRVAKWTNLSCRQPSQGVPFAICLARFLFVSTGHPHPFGKAFRVRSNQLAARRLSTRHCHTRARPYAADQGGRAQGTFPKKVFELRLRSSPNSTGRADPDTGPIRLGRLDHSGGIRRPNGRDPGRGRDSATEPARSFRCESRARLQTGKPVPGHDPCLPDHSSHSRLR